MFVDPIHVGHQGSRRDLNKLRSVDVLTETNIDVGSRTANVGKRERLRHESRTVGMARTYNQNREAEWLGPERSTN